MRCRVASAYTTLCLDLGGSKHPASCSVAAATRLRRTGDGAHPAQHSEVAAGAGAMQIRGREGLACRANSSRSCCRVIQSAGFSVWGA